MENYNWLPATKENLTQEMGEVLGFHKEWIDPDFNPDGVRVGFINGDGEFISSKWNDYQDTYQNDEQHFPSHYMVIPPPPTYAA